MTQIPAQWINDVTPYVVTHLKNGLSIEGAVEKGMDDYSSILAEMTEPVTQIKSERSKRMIQALQATIFCEINLSGAIR